MAVLGSTTKPATTQITYGLNTKNQQGLALTLPSGGPWRIYRLGGWMAGNGSSVQTRLCLWSSGGTLVRNGPEFTAAGLAFALGNSNQYEQTITDYVVAGGTTVIVGWSRNPGDSDGHQFGITGSGSRYDDTQTGSWPGSLSGFVTASGQIGAYLYYEAANSLPTAPTLVSPANGAVLTDFTPNLIFDHNDPDGDPIVNGYDIQVDNNSDFSSPVWDIDHQLTGISGNRVTRTYAGSALTRGTTYYWRARTSDAEGYGPYSATRSFRINRLPTVTKVSPTASGLALIHNLGTDLAVWTSGGSHAKPRFQWTFSDLDGGSQSRFRVRVYSASSGGSTLHDSGEVTSSATLYDSTWAGVNGTEYWWTIDVRDAAGEWAGESSRTAFKMRWGQAIYEYDVPSGSTSSGWQFASTALGAAFLFATATGSAGAGRSSWVTAIGALTPDEWLNVLVRMSSAEVIGGGAGASPSVSDMTFSYIATAIQPERWVFGTVSTDWMLDPEVRRFGSRSLRMIRSATTGERVAYPYTKDAGDDFPVSGSTEYTASVYVRTAAALGSPVILEVRAPGGSTPWGATATPLDTTHDRTTDSAAYPEGWQRLWVRFRTGDSVDHIRLAVYQAASGSAVGNKFWIDAVQVEEAIMPTPWRPGMVGEPVVLDVGGIIVDASAGGIFRLRGSDGGSRDIVELTGKGLRFANDTEVFSPSTGLVNGTGRVRYIPRSTLLTVVSGSTTSTITSTTTGAISGAPAGLVAVDVVCRVSSSGTANALNLVFAQHITDAADVILAYSPSALGYFNTATGTVECNTSGQFKYRVQRTAGTVDYAVFVIGYWVIE